MIASSHVVNGRPSIAGGRSGGGFTLVELMTACVIVSVALLGVYSIFHDSVQTERRLTQIWRDRQAAEAIVWQICQAVESTVEMPGIAAMKTGKDPDGLPFFECLTYGDRAQGTLQRRRYRWDVQSGVLDLRTIAYCGSRPVSIQSPAEGEDPWTLTEPVTIGRELRSLSIQFKTAASDWKGQYARSGSPTVVRVKASVGKADVERAVSCPLTAALLEAAE